LQRHRRPYRRSCRRRRGRAARLRPDRRLRPAPDRHGRRPAASTSPPSRNIRATSTRCRPMSVSRLHGRSDGRAAPEDHRLAARDLIDLSDLRDESWVCIPSTLPASTSTSSPAAPRPRLPARPSATIAPASRRPSRSSATAPSAFPRPVPPPRPRHSSARLLARNCPVPQARLAWRLDSPLAPAASSLVSDFARPIGTRPAAAPCSTTGAGARAWELSDPIGRTATRSDGPCPASSPRPVPEQRRPPVGFPWGVGKEPVQDLAGQLLWRSHSRPSPLATSSMCSSVSAMVMAANPSGFKHSRVVNARASGARSAASPPSGPAGGPPPAPVPPAPPRGPRDHQARSALPVFGPRQTARVLRGRCPGSQLRPVEEQIVGDVLRGSPSRFHSSGPAFASQSPPALRSAPRRSGGQCSRHRRP